VSIGALETASNPMKDMGKLLNVSAIIQQGRKQASCDDAFSAELVKIYFPVFCRNRRRNRGDNVFHLA
jgi:hypothetical protein